MQLLEDLHFRFDKPYSQSEETMLIKANDSVDILSHHDAVAGTAKQAVNNDYMDRLNRAMDKTDSMLSKLYSSVIDVDLGKGVSCDVDRFICLPIQQLTKQWDQDSMTTKAARII